MLRAVCGTVIPRASRALGQSLSGGQYARAAQFMPEPPAGGTMLAYRGALGLLPGDMSIQYSYRYMSSMDAHSRRTAARLDKADRAEERNTSSQEDDGEAPTWEGLTEEEARAAVRRCRVAGPLRR